jgi:phosphoribosyl-dephospho-CoA transferase
MKITSQFCTERAVEVEQKLCCAVRRWEVQRNWVLSFSEPLIFH